MPCTVDPDKSSDPADPSPTTIFKALAETHRQHILQYLAHTPGAVPLGDLAEYLAITDGNPTRDHYERILTGLYHHHLSHLADAGLVYYDTDPETIELVDASTVRPYLNLALPTDTE